MPMHLGGVELARGRLAPVFLNRLVILAEMVSPKEAVTSGFLDKVVSEAELLQVLDECIEKDRHISL
jgi:enoyl-CoA hydratase